MHKNKFQNFTSQCKDNKGNKINVLKKQEEYLCNKQSMQSMAFAIFS